MMKNLFHKPTTKEVVAQSKRDIQRGTRELDTEILALKREEAKLQMEIKKAARAGDMNTARTLAKSIVNIRGQVGKLQKSKAALRGISSTMTTSVSTAKVAAAMNSATQAMSAVQQATDPLGTAKQMQQFAKENAKMEMAQDMIGDTLEDAFDNEDAEAETDDLVGQVLDEIGIDLSANMASAPRSRVPGHAAKAPARGEEDMTDEMVMRLANLKASN